jgi:hypothetical protein
MDKLGYMPKMDMQIGKVVKPDVDFFDIPRPKKKPTVAKATTRKPRAKKAAK